MKNKIIGIRIVLALIMLTLIYYIFLDKDIIDTQNPSNHRPLPIPNTKEYIKKFNEGLKKSQIKRKEKEKNKTPEMITKEKTFWEKAISQSKAAIQDITFYGKVIDQHGDPVSGATVTYVGHGAVFAGGSGTQYTMTDDNGIFVTRDMRGARFIVERFEKEGYQFPSHERFLNNYGHPQKGLLWENYSTIENPFVFKAWKVADSGYPNVSKADTGYGFRIGKTYSMDFTSLNERKIRKEGKMDLDMQVLFNQDDVGNWSLRLNVPIGGLIETQDQYLNMAPESGYQQVLEYSGTKKNYVLEKNYYIHSRGKYYGKLIMRIRPFMKDGSALYIKHILNLDGGRNLESKENNKTPTN